MNRQSKERCTWTLWLLTWLLIAILVHWSERLPESEPADAPAARFSAERALKTVSHLTKTIGHRQIGTPEHSLAAAYLADELRRLPCVEAELQQARGIARYPQGAIPWPPFVYQTTNVVARIPGRSPDALLLNAHFDTLSDSVGAGDDAMGVAAMIEIARAICAGPKLNQTIVLNLNGAEETGLLGAAGFLQHRYASDIKAYLYVDGGPGGKPVVIDAGPGNAWILRAYAKFARSSAITVIGRDAIASGLLPHTGDFVPLHLAGIAGLDIANVSDFWAVHNSRDRLERIDPRSLQGLGNDLLAATRELASAKMPGNVDHGKYVFYDVLGLTVPIYSTKTARFLAIFAMALGALGLTMARHRGLLTSRDLWQAFGRIWLVVTFAVLASLLVATILSFGLRRPHGWYSAIWVAILAFGAPAAAAALGLQWWRRRRSNLDAQPLLLWAGALLFHATVLAATAWAELGIGYLPLWWVGCSALGFVASIAKPNWLNGFWLLSVVPPAVLTLAPQTFLLPFLIADVGKMPLGIPLDLAIALLVSWPVAAIAPLALVPIAGSRTLGRAALVLVAVSIGASGISAARRPYSVDRPKIVVATVAAQAHLDCTAMTDGSQANGSAARRSCRPIGDVASALLLARKDPLALDLVLGGVPNVALAPAWSPKGPFDAAFSHQISSAGPVLTPPTLEVLASHYDDTRDQRTVRLRLVPHGHQAGLVIPRSPLISWSLGEIPRRLLMPDRVMVPFPNAAPEDLELTLVFGGPAPVEVEIRDGQGPSHASEVLELQRKLPAWVTLNTSELWTVIARI